MYVTGDRYMVKKGQIYGQKGTDLWFLAFLSGDKFMVKEGQIYGQKGTDLVWITFLYTGCG